MSKKVAPITTSMSETIKNYKPPTEAEKRQAMKEWAERTLETLLEYSSTSSGFATLMYQSVIDQLSDNSELAIKMAERIKSKRKNKKGQPVKWTRVQLQLLLMMYNLRQNQGETPKEAKKNLANIFSHLTGGISPRTIGNQISKARKIIDENDLEPKFRLNKKKR